MLVSAGLGCTLRVGVEEAAVGAVIEVDGRAVAGLAVFAVEGLVDAVDTLDDAGAFLMDSSSRFWRVFISSPTIFICSATCSLTFSSTYCLTIASIASLSPGGRLAKGSDVPSILLISIFNSLQIFYFLPKIMLAFI